MSKPNIRKRTLQEERRVFDEEWELQFYVVAAKDKMMCLLCNSMITTVKKYCSVRIVPSNQFRYIRAETRFPLFFSVGKTVAARIVSPFY